MRRARSALVAGLAGVAVLAGCGDDAPPPADASLDAGLLVEPPAPPAPPAWPCPAGWRAIAVADSVAACDPWPESGRAECADGEAHFPGEPGCARVGSACPADGWPSELPAGRPVRYVRAGAPAGGDGTRDAPHAAIDDAFFAAPAGTVVAIAPGVYDEMVVPPAGFALVGACASETIVGTAAAIVGSRGRITANDGQIEVRDLTVTGSRPGLWVQPGASLIARDVIVEETTTGGITVLGALDAERLVVRRILPGPGGVFGRGIHAEGEATRVALRGAVIERASEVALFARGASIELSLEDVAIVDTLPQPSDDQFGTALVVAGGAAATLARVVVERAHLVGINVGEAGTTASAEHLVVRDVDAQVSDGAAGSGLSVGLGATATVRGVLVSGNRHAGADAYMPGSALALEDAVILDTRERLHDGMGGTGLASIAGRIELRRAFVRGHHSFGLSAFEGAALVVEDVSIVDTSPRASDGLGGSGIALDTLATAEVRRVRVDASRMVGVFAGEGTTIDAEDLTVLRTDSQLSNGIAGRGVELQRGARGTLDRAVLEANRDFGLAVFGEGTELVASDVVVRGTTAAACYGMLPVCRAGAVGVGAWNGARLTLDRFAVESNELVGIEVGNAALIMLSRGRVAGHPIGLHAQDAGLDPATQLVDVVFEDNDSNLDARSVPVPEPIDPLRDP